MHLALMAFVLAVSADSATDTLKARDAEIRKALPPADHVVTAGEREKLEDLLIQAVDLPAMAKDSLGKRWEKVSESDRKRYVRAFSARFKKASEGEIDFYRSSAITYAPETPSTDGTDGDVNVPTTLTLKDEPTPVVYTVRKEAAGYKIVDLSVDGVSTVDNYKSSFGRIYDKEGIDGLVSRLQKEPPKPVGK
jgi:phospholipid transport system substrate-binding protein